jgi:hypothetical protein
VAELSLPGSTKSIAAVLISWLSAQQPPRTRLPVQLANCACNASVQNDWLTAAASLAALLRDQLRTKRFGLAAASNQVLSTASGDGNGGIQVRREWTEGKLFAVCPFGCVDEASNG